MRILSDLKLAAALAGLLLVGSLSPAQTLYTNSFNVGFDYLVDGVSGTIWDGVYLGAGEFDNTGLGGGGPGATLECNANLTTAGRLSLSTTGTAWEGADDDGFFLFKVVPGDFSAAVHVVSPFDASAYNTAGLQARAFSTGGNPFNGSENYVSWTRFDEYGFANYLRSELDGSVAQINPGNYPNGNYWLRMDRVNGTNFYFYEKSSKLAAWQPVSFPVPVSGTKLVRPDLAGQPLQVGIMHATFNGQLGVQFTDFSLSVSNSSAFAPPAPPSGLALATNGGNGIDISWQPGAGSAGSVVVAWPGTNSGIKEMPANGFSYQGNPSYGLGDALPAAGYYIVYAGPGTNVAMNNLTVNTACNVAVFSYAGIGSAKAYNRKPLLGRVFIPPSQIWARVAINPGGVTVLFSSNPGEWYWLQCTESLTPANWRNVQPGPVQATSANLSIFDAGGGSKGSRYYRLQEVDPLFFAKVEAGNIISLRATNDSHSTEYLNGKLGPLILKYQPAGSSTWNPVQTANLSGVASAACLTNAGPDGTQYTAHYVITNGLAGTFVCESAFRFQQNQVSWTLLLTNQTSQALVVGDLALPLPMNTTYSGTATSTMKHSFISEYGSFIFWMRPDSVGPYLLMTPDSQTKLEFWDDPSPPAGYEVYIHSLVAGAGAAAQFPSVATQGDRWRLPNTSLTLPAGGSQTYGFKFQWANNYDAIRQALVDNGKVDVHIVPGMTLPTNLFAKIALNTTQVVSSINAEFPGQTRLQFLGATNINTNTCQLYQVQFSRLGENKLTINFGATQTMALEFFVTEPLETLIKKRAAYLVSHQSRTNLWYGGLFCDFNLNDGQLITPDNHDTLGNSFQVYEIASDDAGESRPAFLAAKEEVYPVQAEVSALDFYITNCVWGGLQCTTNEATPYGIYGVPDWHTLRQAGSLSIGRGYDYPHIIAMYYGMYQVAKNHPEITTALRTSEYLQRAWGTAMALWSYGGGQATQVGLMNELVIPDVIDALTAEGMTNQAASLRVNWEAKVNYYVSGQANLFASEYAFDATGFESQEAYAKYAILHAGSDPAMGSANASLFRSQLQQFMVNQITANVFDRGWLETAYYYYGSDYRGNMGDDFVVTYMAQMGGWSLLDYALYYATNSTDYLRLGYASYLCGWSTMNTGTPDSNYGFWYPGMENDGGCGGGFEPAPANYTWLAGQPMHRGPWYYSAEANLGFCGALRSGATILSDDPIFGRFCYGGACSNAVDGIEIIPLDGVRQRFHALLNRGNFHLVLENDCFAAAAPIVLQPDLSQIRFQIESGNPAAHLVPAHVTPPATGVYAVTSSHGQIATLNLKAGQDTLITLPYDAGVSPQSFGVVMKQ